MALVIQNINYESVNNDRNLGIYEGFVRIYLNNQSSLNHNVRLKGKDIQ